MKCIAITAGKLFKTLFAVAISVYILREYYLSMKHLLDNEVGIMKVFVTEFGDQLGYDLNDKLA